MVNKEPPIIISLGGSLMVPTIDIDASFLSQFNQLIRKYIVQGKRFIIVVGGGFPARHYPQSAKKVIEIITNNDMDWLGVHATRLNAHLIRTIFQDVAHPRIVVDYNRRVWRWVEPIVIGAGWKPGWSTDYDAIILAQKYKAKMIINLSNIKGVYNKDPKKYKDAELINHMNWSQLEKLVGDKWTPGLNMPLDPISTKLAKKHRLTVIITYGKDLKNVQNIIEGKKFNGTIIEPEKSTKKYFFQ